MVTNQLLQFIKSAKEKGTPDDVIKNNLVSVGWSQEDVTKALAANALGDIPLPPSAEAPGKIVKGQPTGSMWDAFQHILLFISLYVTVVSFALLLHYFVDMWFPGVPNFGYSSYNYVDTIQSTLVLGYLSAFIVTFPIFAFLFLKITKHTQEHPEARMLASRKLLTYLTLIATFLTMVGNVISLVWGLLNGNITINFVLHFVIWVGLAGLVFSYYLNEVKEDRRYA